MIWALVVLTAFTVVFAWLWRGVFRDLASDDLDCVDLAQTHIIILTPASTLIALMWGILLWRVLT